MSDQDMSSNSINFFQTNPNMALKRSSLTSWRGNQYPNVKLRGYYSDVTSVPNAEKIGVSILLNVHIFSFKVLTLNLII